MKYLLLLLLSYSLYGAGFWTLSGLSKADIYLSNQLTCVKADTLKEIKAKMKKTLQGNGIKTDQQDSATLMITLEEIIDEETHYIHIELAVGEEVQTFRKTKDLTYAKTYSLSDFIDTDISELDSNVLESIDYLLSQFSEQFVDDKE